MKAWTKRVAWVALALMLLSVTGFTPHAHAEPQGFVVASSLDYPGSFYRNLYKGCTGADVRTLQRLLKDLGYYSGAVDGIFGTNTRTAVQNFQRRNGLSVDGIAGRNTMRVMLGGDATGAGGTSGSGHLPPGRSYLQIGDENPQVLAMQMQLHLLGYYNGPLTAYFGTQTLAAVKAFQTRNLIKTDGLAGRITLNLMFSGSAIPASGHVKPTPVPVPTSSAWRTLRYGMIGADVAEVQTRLFNLGYYKSVIHGEFNSDTRAAVMSFQQRNWLTVDGIVGSNTYARLFSANAVPADVYPPPTSKPPVPTPTPTPPGTICSHCYQPIVNPATHALAQCGVAGHYLCTNTAPDYHLASTKCVKCGRFKCQGGDHSQLACGHLACEAGTHALAGCGQHYACSVTAPQMHVACQGCNQFACVSGGNHTKYDCGEWSCVVGGTAADHTWMPCKGHFRCRVTAPDLHLIFPCPYQPYHQPY